jgi:uncharacterized protein (DUF58 family)
MVIRPAFWAVLALLIASAIGLVLSNPDPARAGIFYRLIAVALFLMIFSWTWSYFSVRGYTIRRNARGLRQQMGQVFEERFEITNHSRFLRPWVAIEDGSELPGSGGSRVLSWIVSKEQRYYSAYTLLVERGEFHLGPSILNSGDPFGLFTFRNVFPGDQRLLVLPYIVPLETFPLPFGLLPGGKAKLQVTHEVTPHAASVREYAPGDSLNRIHWPSSVRRERLMSKEFEEDPRADVWVFLDAEKRTNVSNPRSDLPLKIDQFWLYQHKTDISLPPDTIEYAVSAAASISRHFIRMRQSVGFTTAGQQMVIVPPDSGERQLGKILETLAFLKGEGKLPLYGLVQSQFTHLQRGSMVVLITPNTSVDLLLTVNSLMYRGLQPAVVLIDPESFGGHGSVDMIYPDLQQRNVPVTIISMGKDLKAALEQGFKEQRLAQTNGQSVAV